VKFFSLDFENKFYRFFDIGERLPGFHPADRAGWGRACGGWEDPWPVYCRTHCQVLEVKTTEEL